MTGMYTKQIMDLLVGFASTDNVDVHEVAISCMGMLAKASSEDFLPYLDLVIMHLKTLMTMKTDECFVLMLQATDTIGCIAASYGDAFLPHVSEFMVQTKNKFKK